MVSKNKLDVAGAGNLVECKGHWKNSEKRIPLRISKYRDNISGSGNL